MDLQEKCETLLKKWLDEIKNYEDTYQFGRCGTDDGSMSHGRYDQLEDCAAYLAVILESENEEIVDNV
jgi:hypothetical protein